MARGGMDANKSHNRIDDRLVDAFLPFKDTAAESLARGLVGLLMLSDRGKLPTRDVLLRSALQTEEQTVRSSIEDFGRVLGLNEPLLVQNSKGKPWKLSDAGHLCVDSARDLLILLGQLASDAKAKRPAKELQPVRVIKFGCFNSVLRNFLAEGLAPTKQTAFRVEFNRDMNLRAVNSEGLIRSLQIRQSDYAVLPIEDRAEPGNSFPEGIDRLDLYRWHLRAVFPKGHPFLNQPALTIEELGHLIDTDGHQRPLLVSPRNHISRDSIDRAFTSELGRLIRPSSMIENPDTGTRCEVAAHGHGFAVVPSDSLPAHYADLSLPIMCADGSSLSGLQSLAWLADPKIDSHIHSSITTAIKHSVEKFNQKNHPDLIAVL
jgi:DNA-binding transcriptional LysR family regulator